MRTKASSSRYRNQEILEELFDEINDYLGDRDIPLVEQYPPSAPSNKTAVETTTEPSTPLNSSDKNQPEPILVESEESEEEDNDNYNTYHMQQQQQSLAHSTPTQQNHHNRRQSNTTSSQQEPDCLLLCPVTNETLSVCMCYSCKKNKSEEVYQAIPTKKSSSRSKQQPRRSWTSAATNGFGLGGMIADRVKQTFAYSNNNNNTKPMSPFTISKQQQYENHPGYEEPRKRSSSREGSGRKRWIPRPKSLPAISAYVQKRQVCDDNEIDDDDDNIYEEEEEIRKHRRPSWSSKKSKHNSRRSSRRSSIYNNNNDDYNEDNNYYVNDVNDNNDYNKKRASAILFDGISEKYEMEAKQQKVDYYYQEVPESQQQEQVSRHHQMYDSNVYGEQGVIEQQYQEPVQLQNPSSVSLSQQQYQPFQQQQQQQQSSEQQPIMDQSLQYYLEQQQDPQQFLTEPIQTSPVTTTPSSLPAMTELPFLTPATRVGEEHYPLKMKDSRTLPTKQERMNAYNNAYYHCIMAKTNLIPWLTKQYCKGPPDTMFEYTPKPKKTSKKLFSIFKLCNTGNKDGSKLNSSTSLTTSNNSQIPWQPSVSPSHLISPPTSASPNSASILTNNSNIQIQQQHQQGLQQTMAATGWPINNSSTNSSLLSPAPPLLGSTSEISMSPSSNATSTFTPISAADDGGANYYQHNDYSKIINAEQPQVKEEEEEEEPFEPVLPRPRSFCSSNISFNSNNFENRPSRSSGISFASTTKSDIRPVSILKKTRSSASLQPQSNKFYSDNDDDEEDLEEDNYYEDCNRGNSRTRKFLEAPTQQQRRSPRRGHVKRRSFSQVEEPIYYMDRRRRNSYQQMRQQPRRSSSRGSFHDQAQEEIYEDDLVMGDDDVLSEEEYQLVQDMNDRPRRILSRARPNSGFYHSGRLNHLRSSRGPPPLWVPAETEPQYEDDIDDDTFLPPTTRRQRRISGGRRPSRPSSRNSIVVYDDMIPIPAPRASPVYYY
ncbi:hypothetical protein INT45_002186 [Circinella minor]|uniref:Uncharacterized protein n=1 Tax=Circinella minor TaxID=1195481 RepID=A0A8H7S1E7_9FUNG|nr:hypothetical protein INT45_002186 [Circinella minor]